jgi:hypothetical protein
LSTTLSDHVPLLLRWLKDGPPGTIPFQYGSIQALTWEDAGDAVVLETIRGWHPTISVRQWLHGRVLPCPDWILFWIKDVGGQPVGHVGLSFFDLERGTVAITETFCMPETAPDLLTEAMRALADWVRESFGLEALPGGGSQRHAA